MINNEKILHAIFEAIDELNEQFQKEQRLSKSTNTTLFGETGKLDSLGLVNLIVATEQRLEETFNLSLTLADEKAMSQKNSPFRSIGTLAQYISKLLQERGK
ncbi:acyl carrier protein [bacterium]|nr:acyl carrier protein [bacterium]